jgi:hypothetical protein
MRRSILSKLTQEALEPDQGVVQQDTDPVVQFSGPLGEAVTKALQTAYDKDALLGAPNQGPNGEPVNEAPTDGAGTGEGQQTDTTAVSLESQANDALGAGLGQVEPVGEAPVDTIAYVVNEKTLDMPTVIDAAQAMDQADEDKDFILIIDGTMDPENGLEGIPQEHRVELTTALESFARIAKVPVFRSVKAFLEQ